MTCDNHSQRDKQTEFINNVKSEHKLKNKIGNFFDMGKINAIVPE